MRTGALSVMKSNESLNKYLGLLYIVVPVIGLDQWTKWLVRTNIPASRSWQPDWLAELGWPARIVHGYNTGAAFGIFQNQNVIFAILAFIMVGVILYLYSTTPEHGLLMRLAVGLYLGGVIGNLIDRLTLGKVTDFISIGTFYIFNVADASINVAVALFVLGFWVKERQEKAKPPEVS
jgi:signal peptidase II